MEASSNWMLLVASALVLITSLTLLLTRHFGQDSKSATARGPVKGPSSDSKAAREASSNQTHTNGSVHVQEEKKAEARPRLSIFFGTQTGTAETFAKGLVESISQRYNSILDAVAVDLEDIGDSEKEIEERLRGEALALWLVATYGDGEPTDSAIRFCRWLTETAAKEEREPSLKPPLSSLVFGVFGLGNTQYEHFNAVGKQVDNHLSLLGGTRLVKLGLGDDDKCIEDDFGKWKEQLWVALDSHVASLNQDGADKDKLLDAIGSLKECSSVLAYRVEEYESGGLEASAMDCSFLFRGISPSHASSSFWADIIAARELHSPLSDRSCLHVELQGSAGHQLPSYFASDHLAILPSNSDDVVQAAASCLGWDLDQIVSLHSSDSTAALIAPPSTLRTLLAVFADLLSSPRKSSLAALADCASDQKEAERLHSLASSEGTEEYMHWVVNSHRSLLEILQSFPSAKPSVGNFFRSVAPRLQPRFYSISSCPTFVGRSKVHITCSVVDDVTPTGRRHQGVCSGLLKRISAAAGTSHRVPAFIRPSTFRTPANPQLPLLLIGPGTGLAPFRAFLQERLMKLKLRQALGRCVLFFGCRHPDQDFIYKEELEDHLQQRSLSSLFTAFSRQGPSKVYVQHRLLEQGAMVWDIISEGGVVYVCGDAKAMARDVHQALVSLIQDHNEIVKSREDAETFLQTLQHEGRYLRDVW